MPTGRVKWYEKDKGFGFLTRDDGGDVFVHKAALPSGVDELKPGQKVEFGVVDSRKGVQALAVKVLDPPTSVAELRRRPAEEVAAMFETLMKYLEDEVLPDLRRSRFPDKKTAQRASELMHKVAKELEV